MNLTETQIQTAQTLRSNLNYFALNCLKIKSKELGIIPFRFTDIQLNAHQRIEERKRLKKMLKIIFLKSRQVGLSTYTEARFFSHIFWNACKNTFVMADKQDSTDNIFEMAKRFYNMLPQSLPKPKIVKLNANEMEFETGSIFRTATAGSKAVGRSMTNNYLHGSEVAFWKNANDIITGLFQTVPTSLLSEIILESTANGTTGEGAFFHDKCLEGLDSKSDWITLFYAWYQHKEYRKPLVEPISWTDEELELKRLYNLDDAQLYWRRCKIQSDFKGREHLFKQEYPICIQEAFIRTGNSLIPLEYIERARKNFLVDSNASIVLGVDVGRTNDRTVITVRQGRVLLKIYRFDKMQEMKLAGILSRLITSLNADKCFIDFAMGTGVYDRLCERGYRDIVELVNFASEAFDKDLYVNRRAEMHDRMRDWALQEGGVFIADSENAEELIADLMLIPDLEVMDSNGKLGLKKKKDIVKGSNISSLDMSDSLALTFADYVIKKPVQQYGDLGCHQSQIIKVVRNNWQERM